MYQHDAVSMYHTRGGIEVVVSFAANRVETQTGASTDIRAHTTTS